MAFPQGLSPTPWDQRIFGLYTWELVNTDENTLSSIGAHPGHYTAKVDPLDDKSLLHRHDFYYCDTLLEPYAGFKQFVNYPDSRVSVNWHPEREAVLGIASGAFRHGRFHRDFNLDSSLADRRYEQWVAELLDEGNCCAILFEGVTAAFIGCRGSKLVLHAVATDFQGRGLAKYLWSSVISELFAAGHTEVCSSVSASNLAVVNLYASLGFRFRNPVDIYHRLVR